MLLVVILGLVGATFGYTLSFLFPAVLWFQLESLERRQGLQEHRTFKFVHRAALHVCVLGLAAAAIGIGSWSEMDKLVNIFKSESKPPFSC